MLLILLWLDNFNRGIRLLPHLPAFANLSQTGVGKAASPLRVYPRSVARQTSDTPPDGPREDTREPAQQPRATPERDVEHAGDGERIGPVAIARHVKPDGRALIVYTRDTPSPA
jgi:hypothetical protein